MKIIIIEDEQHTAEDLAETILKINAKAEILAILNSVKEAVSYYKKGEKPDLVFCDIQLGDGLSFEIFKQTAISSPIIFCTAYDEYALKAFKANGIDYILKPFTKNAIQESLKKYEELKHNFISKIPPYQTVLELLENRKNPKQVSVLVYQKENIIPIRLNEIALFYKEHELTYLIAFDQKKYSINKSLEELEGMLGSDFYRANRQFIINRKAVKSASQYFARKLSVRLIIPFGEKIIISKVKSKDFLNWLASN